MRRLLCVVLSALFILSTMPISVFAYDEEKTENFMLTQEQNSAISEMDISASSYVIKPFEAKQYSEDVYYYTLTDGKVTIVDCNESVNGDITIPSTLGGYPVTTIGDYAFRSCIGLTSVTISKGITIIGEGAFRECIGITSVIIPDSIVSIGQCAFEDCTLLKNIIIPDKAISLNGSVFNNTEWYNNQPNGVVYVGKIAYKYKGDMPSNTCIILRDDTKAIADMAFSGRQSLTSITIPNGVSSIGNGAFYRCTGLIGITIPDSVTSVGYSAFESCTGLTSIIIPDSVTSIGFSVFSGCKGLTSVTIGNSVESIVDGAFSGCRELTSVTIPDSVTSIGYRAFYYCLKLTSVTIGNNVTKIGTDAFFDCYQLTSVTIPNNLISIKEKIVFGDERVYSVYLKKHGWKKQKQPVKSNGKKYRINEYLEDFYEDAIIHAGNCHMSYVSEGHLYDIFNCENRILGCYWIRDV